MKGLYHNCPKLSISGTRKVRLDPSRNWRLFPNIPVVNLPSTSLDPIKVSSLLPTVSGKGKVQTPGSRSNPGGRREGQAQITTGVQLEPKLPIFSILNSIDFSDHFVIIGNVGTGKSTVTPIHEYELSKGNRQIIIREPSRAACNALYYSLQALHPELGDELAVITKDTQINVNGKIKIVTDGVLLRMLAENSINDSSIYFDESHQMSSQLELCMSLAKKEEDNAKNLFRVMSATIDPKEFLSFLGISNLYRMSGRRYPVKLEVELVNDLNGMFRILDRYLYSQPPDESWLVFLPTRRMVEKYADSYRGVYIHGGLEGSEVNRIQRRAETETPCDLVLLMYK